MIKMIKEEESRIITKKFILCDDVVKIYISGSNSVTALRGINFKFQSGNTYVIFGPSGAGKSTLLSIIGGLDIPSSGIINFNNQFSINNENNDLFDFRINNISFIFQEPIFIPFLTVTENIKFFAKKKGERLKEKINDVLEKTNLLKRKKAYPYQLSGGEKQRLSIAIALSLNNNIWLCDEPTGTLDSENKTQIMNLLKQIISNDPSKILIIVTHDPLFQKIADKILILKDGTFELEMNREEFDKFSRKTVLYETLDKDLADKIQKQSILKKIEEIKKELTKE
jgi:putative ABC transport system ATP-binding protein